MKKIKRALLLAIFCVFFCAACGQSGTGNVRYYMKNMQLLCTETDGTVIEGPDFSKCENVEMLAWNSEGALVYAQYEPEIAITRWELWFFAVQETQLWEGTEIAADEYDFLEEDTDILLTQSCLVLISKDESGMQQICTYHLEEHSEQYRWTAPSWSMEELTGTKSVCTALSTKDGQTAILKFEDGTQLRLDPETDCLLSAEESIPETLPSLEWKKEADGYTVEGNWLVKDGQKLRNLAILEDVWKNETFGYEGVILFAEEEFQDAFVEGIADGVLILRVRAKIMDLCGSYREYIVPLSLPDLQVLVGTFELNSADKQFFLVDGKAIRIEKQTEEEKVWEYVVEKGGFEYSTNIVDAYYTLNLLDMQAQEEVTYDLRETFGTNATGAVIPYGDKLIFACVDGSIRSYCPKTEKVSILLEPDESRGCIWKFGLQGSTLCWYELFQQGGQMHTLELE